MKNKDKQETQGKKKVRRTLEEIFAHETFNKELDKIMNGELLTMTMTDFTRG